MKTMKSLLAVAALAGQAYAADYAVTGSMNGANNMGSPVQGPWIHAGSTGVKTTSSVWPNFSGVWSINGLPTPSVPSTPSLSGVFGDFEQFFMTMGYILAFIGINQPHLVYSFNGGTISYTPGPLDASGNYTGGTLTLGQPMVYSGTDNALFNAQTSDATLLFDSANGAQLGACWPGPTYPLCANPSTQFLGQPDMERFYLTLTFTADFQAFVGTAVAADIGDSSTGNYWYSYSFYGELLP